MYAIVDIETTGGYAANNDITEIAIVLHDGQRVVDRFESLVRPTKPIPYYIQVLTGINPTMVAEAPALKELAPRLASMLEGHIFVAHNVNFDYSFLKHHLSEAGFDFNCPKICTVRLTKRIFPGLVSYSLGNLCRHFGIQIENRHRAGGDVDGTARLFEHLMRNNAGEAITRFLKRGSRDQSLPPHLAGEEIEKLPYLPGVYYFHDQKGKVIYVGKAKNLRYRVRSHFAHNGPGRQRQDFLRNIYSISYQPCGTELMAFIMESVEIRRYWPEFNYSQKRFHWGFGLYAFEDRNGYVRLAIDTRRRNLQPLYTFNLITEGHRLLHKLISQFELCPKLCFLQTSDDTCVGSTGRPCRGACDLHESPAEYNTRVQDAIDYLNDLLPTFAVVDAGYNSGENSCILMEKGRFYGMGYVPSDVAIDNIHQLKSYLTVYPENEYIRGLIYSFAERRPDKKIILSDG